MILLMIVASLALIYLTYKRYEFAKRINNISTPIESRLGIGLNSVLVLRRLMKVVSGFDVQAMQIRNFHGMSALVPSGIVNFWLGPFACIFVNSPEMAEPILTSSEVTGKGIHYSFLFSWLGTGLLTSKGHKWQTHRKILTPAFHFKILEQFVPIMSRNGKIMVSKMEQEMKSNDGVIDIRDHILLCVLDVICETAMGQTIEAQSEPDSEYVNAVHKLCDIQVSRWNKPWLYSELVFRMTSMGREHSKLLKVAHSFTEAVITKRKKQIMQRLKDKHVEENNGADGLTAKQKEPFLDTLIHEHLQNPDQFPETDIREEVDTFMFAGHDTTGWATIWTTYLLGLHPEVQERLQSEVDALFSEGDVDRELSLVELKRDLPFTEAVVKESLRLFPPAPIFTRKTDKDTPIGPHVIPPGVDVIVNVYGIHRDPNHWPEPERFLPDRFLNSQKRHPYAYIPFSAGPRNCIGQKFALLEVKALVVKIFRTFRVTSLQPRDQILPTSSLVIKHATPINVRLEARSQDF